MHDNQSQPLHQASSTPGTQGPTPQAPTPATGYTPAELDEIETRVKAAFVTKYHPVPIVHRRSLWLTSGYYRATRALKYVAWLLTDKGGTDHQRSIDRYGRTWWLTGYHVVVTFGSDEVYEQLTMEGTDDGE